MRAALLSLVVLLLGGCASTQFTTRQCIIVVVQEVGENTYAAVLTCDAEKPFVPGTAL